MQNNKTNKKSVYEEKSSVLDFLVLVTVMLMSIVMAREGLALAREEGMINKDNKYAFILFNLDQAFVKRFMDVPSLWFMNIFGTAGG